MQSSPTTLTTRLRFSPRHARAWRSRPKASSTALFALTAVLAVSCGSDDRTGSSNATGGRVSSGRGGAAGRAGNAADSSGASGKDAGSGGNITVAVPGAAGAGGNGGDDSGPYALPPGFTETDLGGFKLGDPFDGDEPPPGIGDGTSNADGCGSTILAVVRDFDGKGAEHGHADFEAFSGREPTRGMVEDALAEDHKPKYTGVCELSGETDDCPYDQQSTSQGNFDQWYRYAEEFNKPYVLYLSLEPNEGKLTFESHEFFPLDGSGWNEGVSGRNFHFTTEVHTEFEYRGGESFTFIGDDDVWVFINDTLALDLGGLHPEAEGTVDLDASAKALGLEKGQRYALELFHAERHSAKSNFRVETNLHFTNCGSVVPEPPR